MKNEVLDFSKSFLSQMRRERLACVSGFILFLIISSCILGAHLWSNYVARTGYSDQHNGERLLDQYGNSVPVINDAGIPVSPTWKMDRFFLGADRDGRDVAVRLLYGGRNSLIIGFLSALLIVLFSILLAVPGGYFGGILETGFRILMDTIWSFPSILLAVAIGTILIHQGEISCGPLKLELGSKIIPVFVIAIVMVPYFAKPLQSEMKALKSQEFVLAAKLQGYGHVQIMFFEILPNLFKTIVVFIPLLVSNAILIEVAISFVGAGVQPPEPSWGSLIKDGCEFLINSPHLTIIPGLFIVGTNLCLNFLADALRNSLDVHQENY